MFNKLTFPYKKIVKKFINAPKQHSIPYYNDPIPGNGELYGPPTEKLIIQDGNNYIQPWNGYIPKCTLSDREKCRYFPVSTANIKVNDVYDGIEYVGNKWMRLACTVALKSINEAGGPFGAVIVQIDDSTGEVLRYWLNHNRVTDLNDPTAHAETITIRNVCHSLGVFDLGRIKKDKSNLTQTGEFSHCEIYSSSEPCPMCYSAICWANISSLYFAATRYDAAVQGVNFSDEDIYNELNKPYSIRQMKIYQCTTDNSLDAFNRWKRMEKIPY